MNLEALARASRGLAHQLDRDRLSAFRPTPPQLDWLQDRSPIRLLRGANQIGKTMAAAADLHWLCTGTHPYRPTRKPPLEVFMVCHSWSQSQTIMQKIHELAPIDALHPDTEYVPGKGYRGKNPQLHYRNGSIIHFRTTSQGTLALASATLDHVHCDEPVPAHIFGELVARLLRRRGTMGISLTPIGHDLTYLRKMVDEGRVSDTVAPLNLANVTPLGGRPLLTQDEIDRVASTYLPIDRAARLEGSWEVGITEGRVFDHFKEEHIHAELDKRREWQIAIGIDHGSDAGSQVALLIAVDARTPGRPEIHVLDEYTSGAAPAENHARGILAMIGRHGLTWQNVDRWTGDIAHGGKKGSHGKMSNSMLMGAFERVLDYPVRRLPWRIRTAFKPRWSVYHGAQIIHAAMCQDRFRISPRCKQTIESLKRWRFEKDGPFVHATDALRYAVVPMVDDRYRSRPPASVRIY